jgi:hypothetical protein
MIEKATSSTKIKIPVMSVAQTIYFDKYSLTVNENMYISVSYALTNNHCIV